jgi:hypothetical protein
MSINEYLHIPSPGTTPPSPTTAPMPPPHTLSINDQIKLCGIKYKIMKNIEETLRKSAFHTHTFQSMTILQYIGLLIEKYKNEQDQALLRRLYGLIDNSIKLYTTCIIQIEECIYLCNNPRIIDALHFLFSSRD